LVRLTPPATTIETPDKHTVILTSDEPRPGMFDWLQYLRIGDRDIIEGPEGHTKVGGTGPFKWVEWRQGESIHMVKNPDYWDTGHPYVDEYHVTIFADQQAMMAALEAGTLDVAALAPYPTPCA
jgi:peptide/nickel transport system substrate-binding protein